MRGPQQLALDWWHCYHAPKSAGDRVDSALSNFVTHVTPMRPSTNWTRPALMAVRLMCVLVGAGCMALGDGVAALEGHGWALVRGSLPLLAIAAKLNPRCRRLYTESLGPA